MSVTVICTIPFFDFSHFGTNNNITRVQIHPAQTARVFTSDIYFFGAVMGSADFQNTLVFFLCDELHFQQQADEIYTVDECRIVDIAIHSNPSIYLIPKLTMMA